VNLPHLHDGFREIAYIANGQCKLVSQKGNTYKQGYGYSQFCELYRHWKQDRDLVLRQEHRPGERLFVDWAGATMPVSHPQTGEVHQASLFVAVLGASNYTYAEADEDQQMAWPYTKNWSRRSPELRGKAPRIRTPR
jgi:hypothetical protein